jgi:hypothetical protein
MTRRKRNFKSANGKRLYCAAAFPGFELLPRLKAIYQQKLYGVTSNRLDEYANLQVVPKRAINWKPIKEQYNQIVKYVTASQSAVAQVALSNALPVIASQAGGLSEAVTENVNGLLFPVGDAKALAVQIINYFQNRLGPVFAGDLHDSSKKHSNCTLIEII